MPSRMTERAPLFAERLARCPRPLIDLFNAIESQVLRHHPDLLIAYDAKVDGKVFQVAIDGRRRNVFRMDPKFSEHAFEGPHLGIGFAGISERELGLLGFATRQYLHYTWIRVAKANEASVVVDYASEAYYRLF